MGYLARPNAVRSSGHITGRSDMNKRTLKSITILPAACLIKQAKEDKYETRVCMGWGRHEIKSYATSNYFQADQVNDLLVISVFRRADLAAGKTEAVITTFIDVQNEKYISRVGKNINKTGWTEAMLCNITCRLHRHNKEEWGIAKHVDYGLGIVRGILGKKAGTPDNIGSIVHAWQQGIAEKKLKAKKERRLQKYNDDLAMFEHFPAEFGEWIRGDGFKDVNFFFYRRRGKHYEAKCTACGQIFESDEKYKHASGNPGSYQWSHTRFTRQYYTCPCCGAYIPAKAWKKQKSLRIKKRALMYERPGDQLIGRQVLVWIEFKRDPVTDLWEKQISTCDEVRGIVDPRSGDMLTSYQEEWDSTLSRYVWKPYTYWSYKGVKSAYNFGYVRTYTGNIQSAFREMGRMTLTIASMLSGRECYPNETIHEVLRKSYIEYLNKAGLKNLAVQAANGEWKSEKPAAKNLRELLGIDGNMLRFMKDINGDMYALSAVRYMTETGEKLDAETVRYMMTMKLSLSKIKVEETGMTVRRSVNYLRKLQEKSKMTIYEICDTYSDYLDLAEELGMDIRDEIVRHSSRMLELHDLYSEQKNKLDNRKRDDAVDKKFESIRKNSEQNKEHFAFASKKLVIVVPEKASDITEEGRLQHHCVGASDTYMSEMNSGRSFILFLRRKEDTSTPYYTLQVNYDGKVIQAYAQYDRKPDWKEVEPVLRRFEKKISQRAKEERGAAKMAATG